MIGTSLIFYTEWSEAVKPPVGVDTPMDQFYAREHVNPASIDFLFETVPIDIHMTKLCIY